MPTSTVEQYIKTVYQEEERTHIPLIQMKQLADAMGVTPGTATAMVKHLAENALLEYTPRRGVSLTMNGRKLALTMVRRHRLIEAFLEQVLGYDWTEVHDDAERLEHAVSETFVQRVDAYLGFPDADPHGDPIPSRDGVIEKHGAVSLDTCEVGCSVIVSRVDNADRERLAFMKEHRVIPGEVFVLEEKNETAGTITLRHRNSLQPLTIGLNFGLSIRVVMQ